MGEAYVVRLPPYWCSECNKEITTATIHGDGKNYELVCPICGNKLERVKFNPSRR